MDAGTTLWTSYLWSIYYFVTNSTFFKYILTSTLYLIDQFFNIDYIARVFPNYLFYLKWFLIFCFAIMPLFFVLNLYVSCALYHIYCHKKEVINEIQGDFRHLEFRNACRKITAAIWYYTAKWWNGYEIIYHPEAKKLLQLRGTVENGGNGGNDENNENGENDENAKNDENGKNDEKDEKSELIPVMIIFYHGALPVDLYYFIMNHALDSNARKIHACVDRFLFKVPGFSQALTFWNCIPGPRDKIIECLVNKNVVALSPGGSREAIFSRNYQLVWDNTSGTSKSSTSKPRLGFAECILQAKKLTPSGKIAVIPMFTKNCRAMFDFPNFVKTGWIGNFVREYLYEKLRWPVYPLYGGFPIKMTSYLGEPLVLDVNDNPNAIELSGEIKSRLKRLIRNNQDVESSSRYENATYLRSVVSGLIQRFQRAKADFRNDITVRVADFREQVNKQMEDLSESFHERVFNSSRRSSQDDGHLHND